MSPYLICIANPECAFIRKTNNLSLVDHLPFISNHNFCVKRSDFPRGLGSLASKTTNVINNAFSTVLHSLGLKEREKLLADFSYEYDSIVAYNTTRYEIGLWF